MRFFLKALLWHPKTTGALLPSSKYLANCMARQIVRPNNGLVIELGGGTGAITKAISQHIDTKNIIVIEKTAYLVDKLKKRFPDITVIHGDVTDLTILLSHCTRPIDTILSGLPLRAMSKKSRDAVLSQIPALLSKNGRFIQFTYSLFSHDSFYPSGYTPIQHVIVWRNVPPAKVTIFQTEKI